MDIAMEIRHFIKMASGHQHQNTPEYFLSYDGEKMLHIFQQKQSLITSQITESCGWNMDCMDHVT